MKPRPSGKRQGIHHQATAAYSSGSGCHLLHSLPADLFASSLAPVCSSGNLHPTLKKVSFSHNFVVLLFFVFLCELEEQFCCCISWRSYICLSFCQRCKLLQLSFKNVFMQNSGNTTQQSYAASCNQPNQPNLEAEGAKSRCGSKTNQSWWWIDFCQPRLNGLRLTCEFLFSQGTKLIHRLWK